MITPLPQSNVTPPDPRGPGDSRNAGDPGDLFARLLGVEEFASSIPLPPSGDPRTALAMPEPAIDQREGMEGDAPAPLAQVFNQEGFFGHAFLNTDATAGKLGAEPIACDTLAGVSLSDRGMPAAAGLPAGAPVQAGMVPPSQILASPQALAAAGGEDGSGLHASPVPAQSPGASTPSAPEAEGEAPEVHPLRRLLRAAAGAQSPVQVAISEGELGLHVTARLAGLEESERRQLRQAITALLARHGFRADHIQINAMPIRGIKG